MTDTCLRSLGFAPTTRAPRGSQAAFAHAWRYEFAHAAADGPHLFTEHPLGIDTCGLGAHEAPLSAEDVFASVGQHDRPALQAAMSAFCTAHGGMGALLPAAPTGAFQPYCRQL